MTSPTPAGSAADPAAASAASTAPVVASRISAVTVFRTGALVERTASFAPSTSGSEEYPDSIRLTGLPLSLDDDTVRVLAFADPEQGSAEVPVEPAPVTATDVRVALEVPEPDRELAAPRDEELTCARHDVRRMEESIAAAESMIGRLETLAAPPRPRGAYGSPPPPSPATARLALLDFRGEELERLGEQLVDLRRQLATATESLRELDDRRRRASTARQAREHELRKSLVIRLRREAGATAVPWRLVVRYLVPGARWAPGYTVRFDPGFEHAQLALRALVCQATGEDWQGVQLTLWTAEPQRWSELPELKAMRIGKRQPPPPRTGWREPPSGTAELFADYDRDRKRLSAGGASRPAKPSPSPPVAVAAAMPEPAAEADAMQEYSFAAAELAGAGAGAADEEVVLDDTEAMAVGRAPEQSKNWLSVGLDEPGARSAPAPSSSRRRGAKAAPRKPPVRRAAANQLRGRPPGRKPPARPEHEPGISAPDDLLDYGRLRLAGAGEPERGKLRPAAGDEGYLELLTLLQVEVRIDVLAAVRRATRTAKRATRSPAPPGYAYPRAWRGFDHAYTGATPVDVAADGVFHNLPLLSRQASAELCYVAVPREAPRAFRVATFENPLAAPLPRGPADVYVGEDFLLTSTLDAAAPRGAVELGLGVDEGLKLARNSRFHEETAGLMRGRLELDHEVDVELANRLARPVRCEVRERIPLSREGDESIEVEMVEVEPDWEKFPQPQRPVEGAYRWRLTLAAGESRTLKLRYVIRLPAKDELVGGNRREP